MGWLDINRSRKQQRLYREIHGQQIRKKQKLEHLPVHTKNFSNLPQELLEKIFIYSRNLDLIFVNRQLLARLRPSYYLESQLLLEQAHNGVLPAASLLQPYVSRELLEAIKISKFEPVEIPNKLLVPKKADLLVYLLQCGMFVDNVPACYEVFLSSEKTTGIKILLNLKATPSKENLIRAIKLGNKYASRIASLFEGSREDVEEVWGLAQDSGKKRVVRVLSEKI